jgi:hypothetical protein
VVICDIKESKVWKLQASLFLPEMASPRLLAVSIEIGKRWMSQQSIAQLWIIAESHPNENEME